jgi:hypothetical protein
MTDDTKQVAWREYCRSLESLGVDPYTPDVSADDPRHEQVQAIIAKYRAINTPTLALPPGWEGHDPIQPVDTLSDLADWLAFQWSMAKGWELAGDEAKPSALSDALRAIRNAFRVLEWFGVDQRPERPIPASSIDFAMQQITDLERWVRQKHKSGWKASPKVTVPRVAKPSAKRGKRSDAIPDDEANILVRKFLEDNPKATSRVVAKGIGIALGRVSDMPAWRAELGRRKASKPAPKKKPIRLTKQMTDAIKKGDDPGKTAIVRERVWNKLIAAAKPAELAKLHAMTKPEREELIDASLEQFAEQFEEADDDDDDCS